MVTLEGASLGYRGLSTDDKPADAQINTTFLELDTGNIYYFNGEEWAEFGGSSAAANASLGSRELKAEINHTNIEEIADEITEDGGAEDEQEEERR